MNQRTSNSIPTSTASLDAAVIGGLRRVARRLRGYLALQGLAALVTFMLAAVLVQFSLDYFTRGLQWSMRLALLAGIVVWALWILIRRVLQPLRLQLGPADAAHLVERRHPELGSALVSAVRFSSPAPAGDLASASLRAATVRRAENVVRSLDFLEVLDHRRPRRALASTLTLVAIATGVVLWQPQLAGLWFSRNVLLQDVSWPRRTRLLLVPPGQSIIGARGDDLTIQAMAEGVQPREVRIVLERADGQGGRESMVTVGNPGSYQYRYTVQQAQQDFRFMLIGGDDRTGWFEARLLERPAVTWSEIHLVPPAYAGLGPVVLTDGQRSAQVLPGTRARFRVRLNKPVVSADLRSDDGLAIPAHPEGDYYVAETDVGRSQTFRFDLRDEYGLEDRNPMRFVLRSVKDEAPLVRLRMPETGELVTARALPRLELELQDTYGLATAQLIYRLTRAEGGQTQEGFIVMPDFRAGATQLNTSLEWPVAEAQVAPGDRLVFLARASDYDDVNGPNLAESPSLLVRVVTDEEFLSDIARREQEYRMDFERLVDNQERLRGELLSWLREAHGTAEPQSITAALTPLERRQRSLAGSVSVVRQQFERILGELRVNRMDDPEQRDRLEKGIIAPLGEIATRDLALAADLIRGWAREPSIEAGLAADEQQARAVENMRAVLARMVQWEGYHEVITMLRDIVRLQKELRDETQQAFEKDVGGVFED